MTRPTAPLPGEIGTDSGLITQLHANIDGVRHHLNLVAMAQAAANMRGGCARRKSHGFIGLDQLGRSQPDAPLLLGKPLLARQKGAIVPEWLVEQWLNQSCTAMRAPDKAPVLQPCQVAADTWS